MVFIPYQKSLWLTRWHVFFKILKIGRAAETMGRVKNTIAKLYFFLIVLKSDKMLRMNKISVYGEEVGIDMSLIQFPA